MGLVINQTYAKLDIHTTRSEFSIQTRQARLELNHKEAQMDIHTELPRVEIDQYECFATSGLMSALDLSKQAAQDARQQVLEYTSKVAQDGDRMADLKNPSPLADIVLRDAFPMHEFGLDYMPKARPKITVTGGIQIRSQENNAGVSNGVQGTYTPASVSINYAPAKVDIRVGQYASISMRNERSGISRYI